ncbi:MAG: cyanophycinase [Acidobacteriota bacterium]
MESAAVRDLGFGSSLRGRLGSGVAAAAVAALICVVAGLGLPAGVGASSIGEEIRVAQSVGGLLLVGGGSHDLDCDRTDGHWSDEVYGWVAERALSDGPNGGNGRLLVLDIEADDGCHDSVPGDRVGVCAFFECFPGVAADHLCARSGEAGCVEPASAAVALDDYDAVWFRGGDQSIYVDAWSGTPVETALFDLWQGGGTLAGTSAGAMIQSEITSAGTAPSWQATSDPYDADVELGRTLFDGAESVLPGVLVDTHFTTRARLGRLAVFLGRLLQDDGLDVLGLGVDQETAIAVEAGVGEVLGEGAVTVLHPTPSTSVELAVGEPPRLGPLNYRSLIRGFRFHLATRQVVEVPPSARAVSPYPADAPFQAVTFSGNDPDSAQGVGAWRAQDLEDATAFYDGRLTAVPGTSAIPRTAVVSRLEAVTAERENRAGAPLWLLEAEAAAGLAIFTDAFNGQSCNAVVSAPDRTLRAAAGFGCPAEQSIPVLDCSELSLVDRTPFDGDGDGRPRHSVALDRCELSLLGGGSPPLVPSRLVGLVFADGFESGDATAWSAVVPGNSWTAYATSGDRPALQVPVNYRRGAFL